MKLELLSTENLTPLMKLVEALWPECSSEKERSHYEGMIDSEEAQCFLVRDEDRYVAFLHVGVRHDYVEGSASSPVAYIEGVYVLPECRQQGIGKLLFRSAEAWAKQRGLRQIASDTEAGNSVSVQFHRSAGFQESHIVCFIKDLTKT
ncbi:MAG TPA: GNAT family N-acetyltransferase [Cyclobacteriaceae bacterium]|nr:GNAT family N-acetyltransferase [Cyclobacteriaceae bacterium]